MGYLSTFSDQPSGNLSHLSVSSSFQLGAGSLEMPSMDAEFLKWSKQSQMYQSSPHSGRLTLPHCLLVLFFSFQYLFFWLFPMFFCLFKFYFASVSFLSSASLFLKLFVLILILWTLKVFSFFVFYIIIKWMLPNNTSETLENYLNSCFLR